MDCDATGEVYDDYSPSHPTTQQQDLKARLERMQYIRDDKHMVIGSEGGNDLVSQTVAFAHGIETPVIAWSDPDMRTNKSSPYYVGGYWSAGGGTPERYAKPVPLKPAYGHIYTDPFYSLPLYKLVYNDSLITTHHWEWGSLKIKDEIGSRMLSDLLYNVPPLYHIDQDSWKKDKQLITDYLKVWSPFHEQAVTQPITSFHIYSSDRLVQSASYGDRLRITVNFSDQDYTIQQLTVPAKSAVIENGGKLTTFHAPDL
ncbi:glycoside hydrolase [Paenibacillus chibensis]|nr:glycoside hydrolase [Paenibacillus chibensis]MEC0369856.1 glycoside hydrolase [Paenibacillus chibensis]